jgi:hypothetical protein
MLDEDRRARKPEPVQRHASSDLLYRTTWSPPE